MSHNGVEGSGAKENNEYKYKSESNKWGMICHLSSFSIFIIPLGNIIIPLLIWQLKKNEFPAINNQGKEAVNFQISITLFLILGFILVFFSAISYLSLVPLGLLLITIVILYDIIYTIVAAIKAGDGEEYRYPISLRLIS